MTRQLFKSGDRVLLKVRKGRKEKWLVAVFQAMQSRTRVIVWVDDPDKLDDDGMRLVALTSLKPYYDHPTDQQRRAKHAFRSYKMGVRLFRLNSPTGREFYVDSLDVVQNKAFGHLVKCKTIKAVDMFSLFPNVK